MAPPHVQWSGLSAPLQTEILYNMSADRRQGWSRIVSRLELTRQQEEEAIKHIHRRASQEDAEERYLKQRQRAQREFLLNRQVHTAASKSEEYPQTLSPIIEDGQLLDSEYHICRTREVLLARKFLKSHQLDPMLAGDWGVVGEELEESQDEPPDSPLPPLDDYGFGTKPTICMRSYDQERQEDDLSSTVRFLNSFGREATSNKGRHHKNRRSNVPLLPMLNSVYQYNRNKHIKKMIASRRSRGAQLPGGGGGGSQEVRLKVDDMGAANIESSPPAQMPPLSSTPPSLKDDESTLLVSPKDLFKVPQPSSSVESMETSPLRAANTRVTGDDNTATSGTFSDNPKAKSPAKLRSQEKQISPQIEKPTDSAKPAETPSKLGRKRKREPEKRDKETEFLQEARFDKPVIEVPTTIPRRKNITEKPLPQKTPRDKDDTAKRPAKMKKHHQRIESITALERQRSTETPKGSKEDAFDNIPGKTASVAPPQSHHRTQSTHIPVEKPRLRTRRSETVAVAVAVAADKPYSLRGENGSSDAAVVVNKVEVVRPKETAAEEAVIGSPRVTRRRGTRRSGM